MKPINTFYKYPQLYFLLESVQSMRMSLSTDFQFLLYNPLKIQTDLSKSYSRDEIIDLLSHSYPNMELERTLGEMEVLSSMTNPMSRVDSTCGSGTVYFHWE